MRVLFIWNSCLWFSIMFLHAGMLNRPNSYLERLLLFQSFKPAAERKPDSLKLSLPNSLHTKEEIDWLIDGRKTIKSRWSWYVIHVTGVETRRPFDEARKYFDPNLTQYQCSSSKSVWISHTTTSAKKGYCDSEYFSLSYDSFIKFLLPVLLLIVDVWLNS